MNVMEPQKLPDPQLVEPQLNQGELLHRITIRVHQSLELEEILAVTVAEVRSFLEADRVKVYRFYPDEHGEVIAEAIDGDRLPSLLGLNFPAGDIPPEARELFVTARQRSIVDLATQQIGLSPLQSLDGQLLAREDIRYRPVDPCHVAYLSAMGVQSSIVVPLICRDQLWGLLVSHHSEPRTFVEQDLRILQLVADQVSVAIAHALLLRQTQLQAKQEAIISRVTVLLHTLPKLELQAALEETVTALQGSGGRIYRVAQPPYPPETLYTWGQQPFENHVMPLTHAESALDRAFPQVIEQHPVWQQTFAFDPDEDSKVIWTIADLYKIAPLQALLPAFQPTAIRGLLVIPLRYRQQFLGYLTIFRNQVDTETLWAGKVESDQRQFNPRESFVAWRESKVGQAEEWSTEAIELAQALGSHFSMAVQQFQLYQQVHHLNTGLEGQVQARTAELQRSLERSDVVKQVSDQIRRTLDSKVVLQTIVCELRKLLNTDRMVVYQFSSGQTGAVTVEAVQGDWSSVLGLSSPEGCFPEGYSCGNQLRMINDIAQLDIDPCHRAFLENIQVKASLTVPIHIGSQLWGLLIAHECRTPRVWAEAEIELLQQLSDQAAIAIQQAELYEQSCAAAAMATAQAQQLQQLTGQLTQTLYDLRQTQSQLVQTERMSSLGQLVAGVAHEINNPVNFIYGNLNYAAAYTQNLLDLVRLYQQHYPTPVPALQEAIEAVDVDFLVEDFPKLIASMRIGADRIRQIVHSLRNFSRLDEAEKKPVDIHEGIDSTLMILQHRLKPHSSHPGIEVVRVYGQLPLVDCYAGQLNQVFMNIIGNAIDALASRFTNNALELFRNRNNAAGDVLEPLPPISSAPPAQITIHTALEQARPDQPAWVVIRIADNGSGVTEAARSHLFDPFFTTKPVGQGTGLGLSISYQIVERHGGTLQYTSELGAGSEFRIEIPLPAIQ
jgi:light-regulated signal transduction histidine kinase (bacteriophytochrome)